MIKHFKPGEIGEERIIKFLKQSREEYPIEIGNVNIEEWPRKLDKYSDIICYLDEEETIAAALFFYCNDLQNKQAYITFLCSLAGVPKGTAYELHKRYIEYSVKKGMKYSRLEVLKTNLHAYAFYIRQGYHYISDHIDKDYLQLEL